MPSAGTRMVSAVTHLRIDIKKKLKGMILALLTCGASSGKDVTLHKSKQGSSGNPLVVQASLEEGLTVKVSWACLLTVCLILLKVCCWWKKSQFGGSTAVKKEKVDKSVQSQTTYKW